MMGQWMLDNTARGCILESRKLSMSFYMLYTNEISSRWQAFPPGQVYNSLWRLNPNSRLVPVRTVVNILWWPNFIKFEKLLRYLCCKILLLVHSMRLKGVWLQPLFVYIYLYVLIPSSTLVSCFLKIKGVGVSLNTQLKDSTYYQHNYVWHARSAVNF